MKHARLLASSLTAIALTQTLPTSCTPPPAPIPSDLTLKQHTGYLTLTPQPATVTETAAAYTITAPYTVTNPAHPLTFQSIQAKLNHLLTLQLLTQEELPVTFKRSATAHLTLTQPRPLTIPEGDTTYTLKLSVPKNQPLPTDGLLSLRIKLHTPSVYDEFRTTVTAPDLQIQLPITPNQENPHHSQLTSPSHEATPLPQY